ncbi:MAG: DNA-directed RNA polymerase, partial [Candidatus Nanoarchaeia archaeon]|nr:DNA-directed RNA polymerase [Candidatus Jingweiarchaeum tengchongense]
GEGVIIPGDGAVYYNVTFEVLVYKPELHEVVEGKVNEIAEYGAFIKIGPLDGLVHVSQVMDDYVSYSKSQSLSGKQTKRTLKVGDVVLARVIAISLRSLQDAKIGLTMRQEGLGKAEWYEEKKKGVKK